MTEVTCDMIYCGDGRNSCDNSDGSFSSDIIDSKYSMDNFEQRDLWVMKTATEGLTKFKITN